MHKSKNKSISFLLAVGFMLAFLKVIYLFFDYYNILDFIVFTIAGYACGVRVSPNRLAFGALLALPTFMLCLIFATRLGYASIVNGMGTTYAISLIVIPLATFIGISIRLWRSNKSAL